MVGHLNSAQESGIILMMPGLPVGQSGTTVGHCIMIKIKLGTSKLAKGSAQPGEAVTRIDFMEHGCPLLIQDQHIAETQTLEETSFTCFTARFGYLL